METRFSFGKNWQRFIKLVDEERIAEAVDALHDKLGDLTGRSFLDVGSGSGLSSLAAVRLGASVVSFDYDPEAVECTNQLRERYAPAANWSVLQGSILDPDFVSSLGTFDVVYSWGVLHHTGEMWEALDRVSRLVTPGGTMFIAIYNDQGFWSRVWLRIKRLYVEAPMALKPGVLVGGWLLLKLLHWRSTIREITRTIRQKPSRGMSSNVDLVDWVGGYPFEVARPDDVFATCQAAGFTLEKLRTVGGGPGCNEFIFRRVH